MPVPLSGSVLTSGPPPEEYPPPEGEVIYDSYADMGNAPVPIEAAPAQQAAPAQAAPSGVPLTNSVLSADPNQQAPAATPAPVVSPGLGSGSAYQAQPPAQAAPPPGQPGEWYSGATDAVGSVAGGFRDAALAAASGDIPTAVTKVMEPGARAQEWVVNRAAERAVSNERVEPGDVGDDPSVLVDTLATAALAPSLVGPESGAPGPLNEVFNTIGSAVQQLPGVADVLGADTFDTWAEKNPEQVAQLQTQGDGALWEGYLNAQNSGSAPPPEWSQAGNPLDAGTSDNPLVRAAQIAGGIKDGGVPLQPLAQSIQSGSIVPFLKNQAWNLITDPTVPLQIGMAALSGGASVAARAPMIAGSSLAARAARTGLSAVSKTAGATERVAEIATGDPIAAAQLAGDVGKGIVKPTAAGRSQLQSNQIMETTGTYRNTIQAATAPPPISPARVTTGAPQTSVQPNGQQVPTPDLAQPVRPNGASPDVVDTQGRRLTGVPGAPSDIVSPSTGKPLVSVPRHPALDEVHAALRKTLDSREMQDVGLELVDDMLTRAPAARALMAQDPTQGVPAAVYLPEERVIAIATDVAHTGQAPRYLDHESVHALRRNFRDSEWSTLVQAAEKNGFREDVRALYGDLETSNPAMFAEEMVAGLYTAFRAGTVTLDAPTRNLLQRLVDFLVGLGRGVNDSLPSDVLSRIDNGEVGKRTRQAAETAAIDRYARVYHGSARTDLDTISATPPQRNFDNAASRLGAHTTPSWNLARTYAGKEGRTYPADVTLTKPYRIGYDEYQDRFNRSTSEAIEDAEAFKTDLIAQGYDGIHVTTRDGRPVDVDVKTPGNAMPWDTVDPAMADVAEVVSFADVPVTGETPFARRDAATAPQEMRDAMEQGTTRPDGRTLPGLNIRDRDLTFFDRFRSEVEGKSTDEIVELLNQPFLKEGAPSLKSVAPNWDIESQARMDDAIEWAKGVYGDAAVDKAIFEARNGKGTPGTKAYKPGDPNALKPPSAESYDQMLSMPMGHLLWYDISGYGFDQFADMTPDQVRRMIDLTAATSGGEVPYNNLKLAMAVYAEDVQNRPGWVPLRDEVPVEQVLQGAGFPGPKFNNFSRNLAGQTRAVREMGVDTAALPTIDMWQFRSYNVNPDIGAEHPELFGIIAHHTIEEGDALQAALGEHFVEVGGEPVQLEHRMMQAGVWVLGRVNEGFDKPEMTIPAFEAGTDYWSVGNRIRGDLQESLPDLGLGDRPLSHGDFFHPEIADVLTKGNISAFESVPHGLVGFAGRNTVAGVELEELWHNARRIPMTQERPVVIAKSGKNKGLPSGTQPPTFEKIVSDFLNGMGSRKSEQAQGAGGTVPGVAKIAQGYFTSLQKGENNVIDRMAAALTGIPDFQISRINTYSWDAASGTMTPSMDIPLMGRAKGTGEITFLSPEQANRLVYGLAQIGMQDEATWASWRLQEAEGSGNSWMVQLPQTHLEEATKGGRKVLPDEIERLEALGAAMGAKAQVVASPRATLVKLFDDRPISEVYPDSGEPGLPPTPTWAQQPEEVRAALAQMGYTEGDTVYLVETVHTNHRVVAEEERGYGRHITNAGRPSDLQGAGITDPRYPLTGRMAREDWRPRSHDPYYTAIGDGRALFDEAQQRLADALPFHRARITEALAAAGHEWETPGHLAERRATLENLGGRATNFPATGEAFARRPRSAPTSLTALGHITGRQRERMLAATDPNARLGYHGYVLDPTTDQLLRHTLDVHWRDGSRARGVEFGDLVEQTGEKLERFVQLERDPTLRAALPREYETLRKLFVPEDGSEPLDFATLAGPGNPKTQEMIKSRVIGEAIADAVERGLPKTAKGSSGALMTQMGGALDEFSRVRGMFGLFAVWNLPKYFTQNWVGNGVMLALKKPNTVSPYLMRLRDVRQTAKQVSGKSYSGYDARLPRMGVSAIPTVDLVDKAQIGGRRGKMIPDPTSPLAKAARPFMSEHGTAFAQTGDYAQRQAVAEVTIDEGYALLNRHLPRSAVQQVRRASTVGRTPLPYTDSQIRKAVGEFLDTKRTMTDLNTGQPYKDKLGRVSKFEPIYTAEEFSAEMKTKLLALNPRVDASVLRDALHGMWSDVELARRSTIDQVKREVEDVAFSWVPTNVSSALSKVVMYPYWTTKAGMSYVKYMLSHPAAANTYARMMDDMEERAEELGVPDWMKGFFRIMNTPMGMEVWYNPTDLIATFLTFPEWAMESGSEDYLDLSALGQKANDIPFLVNPILSLGIYATGAGGTDFKPPDVLGVTKGTSLAASLLNMANAHGLLPEWMGKDEHGEIIPINPKPVDDLVARFGHALSSALQEATGFEPVQVPNGAGPQTSDVNTWIEQDLRMANPEMDQADLTAQVTRIMMDHESPEYLRALEQMSSQAITMGGGLDLPFTPEAFDRVLEGVLRISSPVAITAGPEQKFLDSRAEGMTPSGDVPPRQIPHLNEVDANGFPTEAAEEAQRILDESKYGAKATLASRSFGEEIDGYYAGRDPDGMGAIAGTYNAIYQSRDEESGVKSDRLPEEPVSVGGVAYSPDDIAAMDYKTRQYLAKAYAQEQGTSYEGIQAYYTQRDDFDRQYYADHPLVGSYITNFKNPARDYLGGGHELEYVGALMTQNPAYANFIYDNLKDGQVSIGAALSPDAFLASQGIAPSNYTPINDIPLSGPGREPPPYAPPVPDVSPTEVLNLRAGPGTQYASQMTLQPGTPLKAGKTQGEWTEVTADIPGQPVSGWVASAWLGTLDGASNGQGPALNGHAPLSSPNGSAPTPLGGNPLDMLGGGVASLIDAAGAVVGTMAGALGFASKPAQTSVGKPYGAYDVVPSADGMGVQSTEAGSDRTWMEDMIGPGHAQVNVNYKGPAPVGVDYTYQLNHGATSAEHAAYDIGCDDPTGNCTGTPMYAPMGGRVVCAGYGSGTGEAVGSPACTYSQNTTLPGQAHTIVIEVGKDRNGNPIQLSFNHMGTSTLKAGQTVKRGDMIGAMGNTDAGPHVHLEGWIGDAASGYLIADPQLIVGGYYFQ